MDLLKVVYIRICACVHSSGLTIPNCSHTDIARGKIVQVPAEVYDKGCIHNQEEAIKV